MPEKVSIGITGYREGKMLTRAIEAAQAQTISDWSGFIVIDGDHDEETADIARSVTDDRFDVIIQSENKGPYPTREVIFERSPNDIVIHCDGDDALRPNAVETVTKGFSKGDFGYCGFSACLRYPDETEIIIPGRRVSTEDMILKSMFPGYPILRKTLWKKVGGYHRKLLRGRADFELILRLIGNSEAFSYEQEIIIDKYERPSSVQSSYPQRLGEIHEIVVQSNPEIFDSIPDVRTQYLARGFYIAAWSYFQRGNMEEAFRWAQKHNAMSPSKAVWPLSSDRIPIALKIPLAKIRMIARKLRQAVGI